MKSYPYLILKNAITVYAGGNQHTIDSTHPNFILVKEAIKAGKWDGIEEMINIPKAIARASNGKVTVYDGMVTYAGRPVNDHLATRIIEILKDGFDISPWTAFMDKLYSNPDEYSVKQLYPFLERAKLPITPDGDFLAYKKVREDYKDCHSGTYDNSPGKEVTEDRAKCDNNPANHCSRGLHFCSKEYLNSFGGVRTVIVKVNPRDVVSVPNDHDFQKARACRYVVVGELDQDYSIEDMEKKAVLPPPRDIKAINSAPATTTRNLEDKIVGYINRHKRDCGGCDITVRQVAKAIKATNADVVANAGGKFFIYKPSRKEAQVLSNQRVGVKAAHKQEGL